MKDNYQTEKELVVIEDGFRETNESRQRYYLT